MSFESHKYDNYTLIKFSTDKLDAIVAPDLKSELVLINKQGAKNIIIDIESVKYCDSSGLSAILVGHRLCKQSEGSFIVCGMQSGVEKLMSISQLDNVLNLRKDIPASLDSLFIDEIERNLGAGNLDD